MAKQMALFQIKKHKIIFQLVSQDTSDHSTLIQLTNLKKLAPKSQIEVVCHGRESIS